MVIMNVFKKVICTLLVVALCLTSAPLQGFVGMEWQGLPEISFGEFELPKIDFSSWFTSEAKAVEEQYVDGYYTYTVTDNKATIVSVDTSISGDIIIPEKFENYVVAQIERWAFEGCENITAIVIPGNIKEIGDYAFSGCSQLSSIDLGNTEILGSYIFEESTSLKTVIIPKEVTEASYTLTDSSVETVTFEEGIANIPEYICYNAEQLKNVTIYEKTNTEDEYVIGKYAFSGTNISDIQLPKSLNEIGESAFSNCESLETIVIPNDVTVIKDDAFSNCSNVVSITLNEGLVEIGNYAFYGTMIQSLSTPKALKTIGCYAFADCTALKNVVFNEGLEGIYHCAFSGTIIESVILPSTVKSMACEPGLKYISCFDGAGCLTNVEFSAASNGETSIIPEYALYNCPSIETVIIPDTVVSIGNGAFSGCTKIWNIVLNEGLKKIGKCAFSGTAIESITIPYTVSTMHDQPVFESLNSCLYGAEKLTKVVFAEAPDGKSSIIPDYALYNCNSVETVVLPECINSIGEYAFSGTKIGSFVAPENLVNIGTSAFEDCLFLKNITLNNGLQEIHHSAFSGTLLEEISVPYTVVKLSSSKGFKEISCFAGAEKLNTVVFKSAPEGKTSIIPEYALYDCTSVQSIIIPDSTIEIGANALNCSTFNAIKIPDSVKIFGNDFVNKTTILKFNNNLDAAIYAINNELFYDGSFIEESDKFDYLTFSLTSSNNVSSNVALAIDYSINADEFKKLTSSKFNVYIPTGATISKVTMEQKEIQYSYFSYNNTLTINDIPSKGSIRIYLDLSDAEFVRSYAELSYNKTESDIFAVMDDKNRYGIIISGATNTYSHEYIVSGLTQPDKELDVYVDNIKIDSITTNKVGSFSKTIPLPNKGEYGIYKIKVKSTAVESNTLSVKYYSKAPVLESFTMYYGNKTYDLTNVNKKYNIIFSASYSPSFEVRLTNSEYIEKLMIVSSKPSGDKYIEAVYNKSKGCFVASGYFDKDNKSYVPGTISIAYFFKYDSDTALKQLNIPVFFNEAGEEYIASAELIEHKKTEKDESVTIGFDDGMQLEVTKKEYSLNEIVEKYSQEANDDIIKSYIFTYSVSPRPVAEILLGAGFNWIGDTWVKHTEKDITVLQYDAKTDTFYEDKISVKNSETDSMGIIDTMKDVVDKFDIDVGEIGDISELMDKTTDLLNIGNTQLNLNNIKKRIQQSSGTYADKQEWLKEIDDLESDIQLLCILKILMPIVGKAAGGIGDILFASGAGTPGSVIAYIVDGLSIAIDETFLNIWKNSIEVELKHYKELNEIIIADEEDASKVNWNVDPSGYVYEAVSSNRLQDVTTTIYFKDLENYVALWDASDYDQENPILTDDNGQYAWDVPEGLWQVKCEKNGYETTYSEWLPVPPPQLDVNIGLITTRKPNVEFINVYNNYFEVKFDQYMDIETINNDNVKFYQNSSELQGVWEAIDKEVSATDSNIYYAKTFKFKLSEVINGKVEVNISNVENYAGLSLDDQYINNFEVEIPISEIELPDLFEITYGKTDSFIIKALPAEASKNKIVNISLSNDYVVDCAKTVQLDQNGEAIIVLNSLLPGEVVITCSIEDTIISDDVRIVSIINGNEPEKKYSITWLVDGEETVYQYSAGDFIIIPNTPFKQGFIFNGWSANIPQIMPEEDLIFEAMFIECEHSLVDWEIVSPATCTETGEKVKHCACGINVTDIIPATGHKFDGSACKTCDYDKADDCSCNCHKGGIAGFFFKIILFFQKIFKSNKECKCGIYHY